MITPWEFRDWKARHPARHSFYRLFGLLTLPLAALILAAIIILSILSGQ